jgi:peptide/nickel transport system substrate-binding protein
MKRLTKLVLAALVISLMMVGTVFAYQQAPMLDNMDLPPIEERLPENPMVLPVFEAIGQYGGTLRMSMKDPFSTGAVHSGFFSEPLVKWDPTGTGFEANLAEKWEVSEDGLVYRFYLRKGVKWSDGVPLTTEDIEFWYYDNLLNTDLTPAFPVWLSSGGEPVELHIIDDYTFEFRLKEPNAVFIDNLAFQAGGAAFHSIMTVPKHYLKNFHPDYVDPDELLAKAQADGFDTWYDYYYEKRDFRINPDIPVLTAWKPESGLVGREIQYWTRNPYYWKVDESAALHRSGCGSDRRGEGNPQHDDCQRRDRSGLREHDAPGLSIPERARRVRRLPCPAVEVCFRLAAAAVPQLVPPRSCDAGAVQQQRLPDRPVLGHQSGRNQ